MRAAAALYTYIHTFLFKSLMPSTLLLLLQRQGFTSDEGLRGTVLSRVMELFEGHPDLVDGFLFFLPDSLQVCMLCIDGQPCCCCMYVCYV